MKKRTLRLGRIVAAITLPFVMGACLSWQQQAPTGPRDVVVMTNERVHNYTRDASYAKDPNEASDAKGHEVHNEVLAQIVDLQPGDKARGFMGDPFPVQFEGDVTDTWDGGFEIEVKGESTPRRVDFADVSSLQRSRRIGGQARKGALYGGGSLGGLGFFLGYCVQILSSSSECAEDLDAGLAIGLVLGAAGALIGAGVGAMISHDGPFEAVNLEGFSPLGRSVSLP